MGNVRKESGSKDRPKAAGSLEHPPESPWLSEHFDKLHDHFDRKA